MDTFKVCYVSPEVSPFAALGEMANTSRGLPIALKNMGQDIRLMMPKYKSINERKYVLREVIRLREVNVSLDEVDVVANGKTAFLPNSKVHVYFLSIPEYFDKKGIYRDPGTRKPHTDNAERYALFCKSVFETLKLLYWAPDIIHCCDWPTSLVPYYLKRHYQDDEFFANTRTVLTVHNFDDQGAFPLKMSTRLGILDDDVAKDASCEHKGQLNMLKAGLTHADAISTVSTSTVAQLLADPKSANGLGQLISDRSRDFSGITNGIDYNVWNPETDAHLSETYDSKSIQAKSSSKETLCEEFSLNGSPEDPVVLMVTRLDAKNTAEKVREIVETLLKLKVRLILLADGNTDEFADLRDLEEERSGQFAFRSRLDARMRHLIAAGTDISLLPVTSLAGNAYFLRSLRYGTVPIATADGPYADLIKPFDPESGKGNSLSLTDSKKATIIRTVKQALKFFEDKKLWTKLQKNGMRTEFSWDTTADEYLKLYRKAASKKR